MSLCPWAMFRYFYGITSEMLKFMFMQICMLTLFYYRLNLLYIDPMNVVIYLKLKCILS